MDFTVAICTYKRADVLPQTLDSLAKAKHPAVDWELLIVDNNCDPGVEQIVRDFSDRLPIRYTSESQTGIARARNRATESAKAPILLFADDDVLFDEDWLTAMVNTVHAHQECDFWGGRIEPIWTTPRPAWFDLDRCPMLGDSIVCYELGRAPRRWDPNSDPAFYTCNLGIRVAAIREAGMFDVTLGHQGSKRGGGEDSWMIRAIVQQGGVGWYAADALLHHPVPPQRVTRRYARSFAWWQGRIGVDMLRREHADSNHPDGQTPRWLYRVAAEQLIAGLGRWIAGLIRRDPGLLFAGQFGSLFNLSKLWHAVRT